MFRWSAIAARLPGRTDNEIKNFWHTHLKKRIEKSEVHNGSASSYPSQKARATSSSGALITMPRVAAVAPSAASSFSGKVVIANDGLASRRSAPSIVGPGFYNAVSYDTSGETLGNHGSNQLSEEMEFWYNVFIKSGQLS